MKAGWLLLALGVMLGSAQAQVTTLYSAEGTGTQNVPFSADEVQVTDRVLGDGNHIHQERHGRRFRDSQGRTRMEMELRPAADGHEAVTHVHILDPVKKVSINWNSQQRVAMVQPYGRVDSKPGVPVPPSACAPRASGCGGGSGGGGALGDASLGSTVVRSPSRTLSQNKEGLGTQVIEGFTVTGTRFTRITPAGEMGNEKPVTTVHETWFSPELHLSLVTQFDNPMSGVSTIRLINIQRGEPDPQLFQPPADYTVKELNPQ